MAGSAGIAGASNKVAQAVTPLAQQVMGQATSQVVTGADEGREGWAANLSPWGVSKSSLWAGFDVGAWGWKRRRVNMSRLPRFVTAEVSPAGRIVSIRCYFRPERAGGRRACICQLEG